MTWNDMSVKQEKQLDSVSDSEIEKYLFGQNGQTNSINCGFYGADGLGKTGIAMDCRTDEEIKQGKKLIIFDFDGGATPIKEAHHKNDKNIIIKNPLISFDGSIVSQLSDGSVGIDYNATFSRTKKIVDYIRKNIEKLNVKAVIVDGLDKFLKHCELCMRYEIGAKIDEGIKMLHWNRRLEKYEQIISLIEMLPCEKYYTAHEKEETKQNKPTGVAIATWHPYTTFKLNQKFRCYKEEKIENGVRKLFFIAKVEKFRTNQAMVGKEFIISTVEHFNKKTESKWNGLKIKDNAVEGVER